MEIATYMCFKCMSVRVPYDFINFETHKRGVLREGGMIGRGRIEVDMEVIVDISFYTT